MHYTIAHHFVSDFPRAIQEVMGFCEFREIKANQGLISLGCANPPPPHKDLTLHYSHRYTNIEATFAENH